MSENPGGNLIRRAAELAFVFATLTCWQWSVWTAAVHADASPDPSTCHPQALVTPDNDMRLEGDNRPPGQAVTIPAPVLERMRISEQSLLGRLPPGTAEGLTCDDLFPHTYRISIADQRQLYVSEISIGFSISFFYLIVSDPLTGSVTRDPPRVGAKDPQSFGAKDPLVKKPFVSLADLFQNHHPQIVFEERVHNGNMYNAVVYHYFDVGPDLGLTRVLARETRLLALNPEGAIFFRELTLLSANRLRLDTFELLSPHSAQRKEMGYVILESPGPGVPFHVVEHHAKDSSHFDCLVTCQDESPGDDAFLRKGYTFYY
jgi:hypothetical protein